MWSTWQRSGSGGLCSKGWRRRTAWHEKWQMKVHQRRLLAASAGRLAKPKLAHAVSYWRHDWEVDEASKAAMAAKRKSDHALGKSDKEAATLRAQVDKLTKELADARQAMAEGRGHEAEMQRRYEEQIEKEQE